MGSIPSLVTNSAGSHWSGMTTSCEAEVQSPQNFRRIIKEWVSVAVNRKRPIIPATDERQTATPAVAQLVERHPPRMQVGGSSPPGRAIYSVIYSGSQSIMYVLGARLPVFIKKSRKNER